eukprot:6465235-Amphidinium_carterae.1
MGGNPQLARWWSVEQRSRSLKDCRWMLVLVLLHLGYCKGWWPRLGDCPLFTSRSRYMQSDDPGTEDPPAVMVSGPCDAGDGGEDNAAERVSDVLDGGSLSKARDACSQRRSGSILKEVTHLLCDDIGCFLWQGLSHLTIPLESTFADVVKNMKGTEGISRHLDGLATGELFRVVISKLLAWFGDPAFASACLPPAQGDGWTDFQVKQISVVGQHLFDCVLRLCTELHISSLMFAQPPLQFMRLVQGGADEVERCLKDMRHDWESLEAFEKDMKTIPEAEEAEQLHRTLIPPQLQWVREAWVRCYEGEWKCLPLELQHQLHCFERAHHSTLLVENTFNECRAQARKSKTYRQSGAALWNVSCYGHTAAEFGRGVERVSGTEHQINARKLPQGLFSQSCCDLTVSDESLNHLCERSPSWPTHSAASLKQAAVAWELLKSRHGQYKDMGNAWLSLLLEPGTLILDTEAAEKRPRLVTGVTKYGYFWMRPELQAKEKRVVFRSDNQVLQFDVLDRPQSWKVAKLRMRPPTKSDGDHTGLTSGFMLDIVHDDKAVRVPQFAAGMGFKRMTCFHLRKLRKWLGLQQACKPSEAALVTSLLEHLCAKSYGEDLITSSLQARKVRGSEILLQTANVLNLEQATVAQGFMNDVDDADDADLLALQEWEALKHQRDQIDMDAASLKRFLGDWMTLRPVHGTSSASTATASTSVEGKRKFMPLQTHGFSADEVQPWLPPGASMSKDVRENRWRLRCKHLPGSGDKSKSFGKRSGASDNDAMKLLLLQAWAATTAATGLERPFEIEDMVAPEGAC